jgi:hypothetical protein
LRSLGKRDTQESQRRIIRIFVMARDRKESGGAPTFQLWFWLEPSSPDT